MGVVIMSKFSLNNQGFSILAVSSILMILSLGTIVGILSTSATTEYIQVSITEKRLEAIKDKMEQYVFEMGALPCPANPTVLANTAEFAKSADCTLAAISGMTYIGTSGTDDEVIVGSLPTRDLNLPDEYGFDAWGNKFTYSMFKKMAIASEFSGFYAKSITGLTFFNIQDEAGQLEISPNSTAINTRSFTPYVIVSHGKDGKGAYQIDGGQTACSGSQAENCDNDKDFINYTNGDVLAWHNYETIRLLLNKANPSNLMSASSFISDAGMFDMEYTSNQITSTVDDTGRVYDWTSFFDESLTYAGVENGRLTDRSKIDTSTLLSGNTLGASIQASDTTAGIPRHKPGKTILVPAGTYLIKATGSGCRNHNGQGYWPYIHPTTSIVAERQFNDEDHNLNLGYGFDSTNQVSTNSGVIYNKYLFSSVSYNTAIITLDKPTKLSYRYYTSTPAWMGGTEPAGVGGYPGCISNNASSYMGSGWVGSTGIAPYFTTANMVIIRLY